MWATLLYPAAKKELTQQQKMESKQLD